MVDGTLRRAVQELWDVPARGSLELRALPSFRSLAAVVHRTYPEAGRPVIALENAIRNLGPPCVSPMGVAHAVGSDAAAVALDAAFRARRVRRRHLAPLDLADEVPDLAFGRCEVRRYTLGELRAFLDCERVERVFAGAAPDPRLAEVRWLVVEEEAELEGTPEDRVMGFPFSAADWDPGRVHPHASRLPVVVADAVLFLLLAPWEDWASLPAVDWRGFRIPWVHTVDDDLFARPRRAPSLDGLSWATRTAFDAEGMEVEYEAPVVLPLAEGASVGLARCDDVAWANLAEARRSPLFETPVAHFLVRAFLQDGIDEFLAHLTTVEAALGTRADYGGGPRAGRRGPQLRPAARVAARLAALLGDPEAADDYLDLFDVRSTFLHGRSMGPLTSRQRGRARCVARRTVEALAACAAKGDGMGRDERLQALLEVGVTTT